MDIKIYIYKGSKRLGVLTDGMTPLSSTPFVTAGAQQRERRSALLLLLWRVAAAVQARQIFIFIALACPLLF